MSSSRVWPMLLLLLALLASPALSDTPPYLEGGAVGVYGTKIIVAGGRTWSDDLATAASNDAIWEFETLNNTWTRVASGSIVGDSNVDGEKDGETYSIRGAVIGDKMYLITSGTKGNTFFEYSMATRQISQLNFPTLVAPGVKHFAAIATTDTFYVVAGRRIGTYVDMPTCFRAEIATTAWSPCGNLSFGLNQVGGASNNALQYMLVYGGYSSDKLSIGTWALSRKTDVALSVGWTVTENVGLPIMEKACVVGYGNGFLVYGGRAATSFTGNRDDIYFGSLYQINMNTSPITSSTLFNATALNGNRWGRAPMCAVVGNVFYAIGRPLSSQSALYQERIVGVNLTAPDSGLLKLDPKNSTTPENSGGGLSTGVVAGIGAGAGLLAIVIAVGAFIFVRRNRSKKLNQNPGLSSSDPLTSPTFTNGGGQQNSPPGWMYPPLSHPNMQPPHPNMQPPNFDPNNPNKDNSAGWPFIHLSPPTMPANFDPNNNQNMYLTPLSTTNSSSSQTAASQSTGTPNQSSNLSSVVPGGVLLERS
ncbi:hypothetical protein BJ742DRAFT_841511 [Cladochytrium replicatum]|nr:hypothetical protein BJ742DRAFT_841511 [Cladochytrium replicatum]